MPLTCHSEVGKLHSLFIKRSKDAFIDDDHVAQQWKALNYLSKPGFDAALTEYDALKRYCKPIVMIFFIYQLMMR